MVEAFDKTGSKKVYGIDLGTTYSAIAAVNEEGQAEIVPNADGDPKTASAVFFEPSDEPGKPYVVVGKVAKELFCTDPEHFVDFVKCHMGDSCWNREIEGISWTPEMISAEIIKKLMRDAEAHGEKVNDVVIAYPCYYGSPEKQALAVAWRLAGLNVLRTITEPVAVAFHYGLNKAEESQTAVIYDLGGGTFNVSVVKAVENNIEVVCSDGNNRLGGEVWTAKITQYLADKFAEENGVSADDLLNDPETFAELSLSAEVLKQTLTVRPKATSKVVYNDILSRIEIDRNTFDALTKPLLDETEALTAKVMYLARSKGVEKFDRFLLAGGASKMPQVIEMVKEKFGTLVEHEPEMRDADEAVARGAAIYGKIMDTVQVATPGSNADSELPGGITMGDIDILLPDMRASRSYGVRLSTDNTPTVYNAIVRGAVLPAEGKQEFVMPEKDVEKLTIQVFANDSAGSVALLNDSEGLGEVAVRLPRRRSIDAKVQVKLTLSEAGVLSLDMTCLVTSPGTPAHVEFNVDQNASESKDVSRDLLAGEVGKPITTAVGRTKKVYGIDLGTTYSAIAVVNEEGRPEIVPNLDGDRITASAVFFEPSDEPGRPNVVVGKTAKEAGRQDADHFVDLVKYYMGDAEWKREIEGISWTPEMISAAIIKKLVKGVEYRDAIDAVEQVKDVVITCPAYFNDAQRCATRFAGEILGLKVLAVINEPTAAALHYGLNNVPGEQAAVVYDLGGATFDVTVVKVSNSTIETVCSDGNHKLGGRNWDAKVAHYLAEKFAEENEVAADDLLNDPETSAELRIGAEIVRETLTLRSKATRRVSYNGVSSLIKMDRETFDALTKPLLDETEALTEKMMALAAEKGITKFDEFLLVGGSTRMLQVREMVKRVFGPRIANEPRMQDVDEAVAKGAAIYGKIMTAAQVVTSGSNADSELPSDISMGKFGAWPPDMITSRSYGVRLSSDNTSTVCNAIVKGELFPVEGKQEFPMPENDAEKLDIQVFANDATGRVVSLKGSEEIGDVIMRLPHKRFPGAKVQVKLAVSEAGVLSLDMAYLMTSPGVPAHVEFYVDSEGHVESGHEPRRETADLIVE
jgi:molecular chaperone DnaK (HSP70)